MAAWNDISNLWWLRTDNQRVGAEALQGLEIGARMAQNKSMLRLKEFEAETERKRIQAALDAKLAEQSTQTTRAMGLSEISSHLALVAKDGAWDKPESEATFWNIAAKYPQSIERNDIDAIYNNTFNEARRRKARASGTGEGTAQMKNDLYAQSLLEEADQIEPDFPDEAKSLRSRAESVRNSGRLYDRSQPLQVEVVAGAGGKSYEVLRLPGGGARLLPRIDESKVSAIDLARYRAETSAIMDRWENYDKSFIGADGKSLDPAKLDAALNDAYERAQPKKKVEGPEPEKKKDAAPSKAGIPSYDPKTRRLIDAAGNPIDLK
jgi:hypothetical protein